NNIPSTLKFPLTQRQRTGSQPCGSNSSLPRITVIHEVTGCACGGGESGDRSGTLQGLRRGRTSLTPCDAKLCGSGFLANGTTIFLDSVTDTVLGTLEDLIDCIPIHAEFSSNLLRCIMF